MADGNVRRAAPAERCPAARRAAAGAPARQPVGPCDSRIGPAALRTRRHLLFTTGARVRRQRAGPAAIAPARGAAGSRELDISVVVAARARRRRAGALAGARGRRLPA
eukprot:CAMPEP_0206004910 /NCGR_PEP_ID=MMETSP1464-20131121/4265_1 /ASSEMBLY_ACC=CAM_ASM_001124 /TAXON_ID=119497 /ORGANISM="Exanthemachrysis gayraliae, Strain RCC1523" /LENGTH=107 /DNA_ID=CAMNT_0053378329 /DNA_START=79 /DNA_END=399 /DNA_ORIENTATION=-